MEGSATPSFEYLNNIDEAPTRIEMACALKKLENYKSSGVDGINNEQLKYGEVSLVDSLVCLFKKVWEEEQIPEHCSPRL